MTQDRETYKLTEAELAGLSPDARRVFASRCALRAFPAAGAWGSFGFWGDAAPHRVAAVEVAAIVAVLYKDPVPVRLIAHQAARDAAITVAEAGPSFFNRFPNLNFENTLFFAIEAIYAAATAAVAEDAKSAKAADNHAAKALQRAADGPAALKPLNAHGNGLADRTTKHEAADARRRAHAAVYAAAGRRAAHWDYERLSGQGSEETSQSSADLS